MTNDEFRDRLAELGFNQSSFSRRLIELGDTRSFKAVLKEVHRLAAGTYPVSGPMAVVLNLLAERSGGGPQGGRGAGR